MSLTNKLGCEGGSSRLNIDGRRQENECRDARQGTHLELDAGSDTEDEDPERLFHGGELWLELRHKLAERILYAEKNAQPSDLAITGLPILTGNI